MAHNVETMFYTREKPWHGLGVEVSEAPCSAEALELAGLNWQVKQTPVFIGAGTKQRMADKYVANVRSSDDSLLGIVSDRYKIVQNQEAFEFTDMLLGSGEVRYETAGSLQNGKKVWLLAKLPSIVLVKDLTEPYLLFTNSHDGTGSLQVAITPVRVVCNNTLNLAMQTTKRSWSTKHTGNMDIKLTEAQKTLEMTYKYLDVLKFNAVTMANQIIDNARYDSFVENLFPITEELHGNSKQVENIMQDREELFIRYKQAPDLKEYQGTAWGVINAVSDFASHHEPRRNTPTWRENRFIEVVEGNSIVDKAYKLLQSIAV